MIRRPPRSTLDRSSAASDVYKRQDEGIPATVAPYSGTLLEKLDEAVKQRPEAAAVWFKGTTLTWRQVDELSNQFANALVAVSYTHLTLPTSDLV